MATLQPSANPSPAERVIPLHELAPPQEPFEPWLDPMYEDPDVPLPDPPKRGDMQDYLRLHRPGVGTALELHLARSHYPVLVVGGAYLCFDTRERRPWRVPDLMVALEVEPDPIIARNGYVIHEHGKPPDLVIEIASSTTGTTDYTAKRLDYARFGVLEYWRFDHTGGEYHDVALAGDRLVDGEYQPIPITVNEEGIISGYSQVLGLEVRWDNGTLRFCDPVTGDCLPTWDEMQAELEAATAARDAVTAERDTVTAERDTVTAERDAALERVRQLEEQLRSRQSE